MSNNKQGAEKNMTAAFIALGAALVAGVVIFVIALTSVFSNIDSADGTTEYNITAASSEAVSQNDSDLGLFADDDTSQDFVSIQNEGSIDANQNGNSVGGLTEPETKKQKNEAVEYYEQLSPNGENKLSDHYDNKYIKKISAEYGVDSDLLVAIYSEPDTGNNFVLHFNGKKDSNGNVVKSPDTLEKVYQIDKEGKVSIATGTDRGNVGVSYAEGMLCFNMVKTLVMTQYPDYFTGLD